MGADKIPEKTDKNKEAQVQEKSPENLSNEVNGDKSFNQDLSTARERMAQVEETQKVMNEFPKFDADEDGFLTKEELTKAMENEQDELTRRGLERLIANYDSTMARSNDEWGFENFGVTRDDLQSEHRAKQDWVDDALVRALEKRGISDLDADKNGMISREEVSTSIENGNADDKLMLDYMLRKYDDIKSATSLIVWDDEGITANDWSIYNHPYAASDPFGPS